MSDINTHLYRNTLTGEIVHMSHDPEGYKMHRDPVGVNLRIETGEMEYLGSHLIEGIRPPDRDPQTFPTKP